MRVFLFMGLLVLFVSCTRIKKAGEATGVEYLNGGFGSSDKTIVYFKNGATFTIPQICDYPGNGDIEIINETGCWKIRRPIADSATPANAR